MRPGAALLLELGQNGLAAVVDGLGVHHHAAAAAIGVVVHLLLAVEGVVPDLMAVGLDEALAGRPAQDALVQHLLAHVREEGGDVDAHAHGRSPFSASVNMPGMGSTSTRPFSRSTCFKKGFTAGNRVSAPFSSRTV